MQDVIPNFTPAPVSVQMAKDDGERPVSFDGSLVAEAFIQVRVAYSLTPQRPLLCGAYCQLVLVSKRVPEREFLERVLSDRLEALPAPPQPLSLDALVNALIGGVAEERYPELVALGEREVRACQQSGERGTLLEHVHRYLLTHPQALSAPAPPVDRSLA